MAAVDLPFSRDADESVFRGPGVARALARSIDWGATSLGPVCAWPQSLRTAVDMCLASRFPTALLWGPQLLLIHNEEHIPFLGKRFPGAMGRPAHEVLTDTWTVIGPLVQKTLANDRETDENSSGISALENIAVTFDRDLAPHAGVVTISVSAVRDESGRPAGVVIAAVDIAADVFAEAKLRESEEKYRSIVEDMGQALALCEAVYDANGRMVDYRWIEVNHAQERLTRLTRAEMVGRTRGESSLPFDQEYMDFLERVLRSGRAGHIERVSPVLPGWTSLSCLPLARGRFITLVTDVTQQKRAEAELRASEQRFRALAETSPLGVGVSSLDGRIVYTNRAYEKILGAAPGALIGQPCTIEYYDPTDRDVWVAAMKEHRDVTDFEVRFRQQDGSPVWVSMNLAPIEFGGRQAIIGVVQDITGRKRAQAIAARERAHRERDVLRRQLAAAEEGERRRLALEVHDQLGQQVTAFRLGIEDAMRLAPPDESQLFARLEQLHGLAEEMTTGVRAITLELRPPELDDLGLASALETYAREWSARYGVSAEIEVTGLHDRVMSADASSAIYRIAQEALTNVAKHAAANEVSVLVSQTDGEICLIIEDDGRGFDVDETAGRARLDRRFGLAGMRERATLAGGSVTIESAVGSGTTLYVRLPVR